MAKKSNAMLSCSMMLDRKNMCKKKVFGRISLACDESSAKLMPVCRDHMIEVVAENARYEKSLFKFVARRVVLDDADEIGTRSLAIEHRNDEMNGQPLLPAYWVCRNEACVLVPRDEITYPERCVIADTLTACGEFLEHIQENLHMTTEFLRPWFTDGVTVGEAHHRAKTMVQEILTTVPGGPFAQVDVIMDRFYKTLAPK